MCTQAKRTGLYVKRISSNYTTKLLFLHESCQKRKLTKIRSLIEMCNIFNYRELSQDELADDVQQKKN